MTADYIYEPSGVSFTDQSTLVVTHNKGRDVGVEVYDTNKEQIYPNIVRTDNNTVTIKFYVAGVLTIQSGKVLLV